MMNHLSSLARRRAIVLAFAFAALASIRGAETAPFTSTLTPTQRASLGLDKLSAEQRAALDAAIAAYRQSSEVAVVQRAAETAVAEYKRKTEPVATARAVEAYKRQQAKAHQEIIEAKIDGRFTGWEGHTLFKLDNGQIWRQAGTELYYASPEQNTPVEIRLSKYGSYRLHLSDGAWVTVVRVH